MVDLEKTLGTAAGIVGASILAGVGIGAISVPIEAVKGVMGSIKKTAKKEKGSEDEKEPKDMMSNWEKTWMG